MMSKIIVSSDSKELNHTDEVVFDEKTSVFNYSDSNSTGRSLTLL